MSSSWREILAVMAGAGLAGGLILAYYTRSKGEEHAEKVSVNVHTSLCVQTQTDGADGGVRYPGATCSPKVVFG
jgi:hypothetical protein